MEKFIELINEHQKEVHGDYYLEVVAYRDGIFWSDGDCTSSVMDEIHLISKPYGFIKWLVDKDKIDLEAGPLYGCQLIMHNRQPYTLYETLLMLLSISDTPIEDLLLYLK